LTTFGCTLLEKCQSLRKFIPAIDRARNLRAMNKIVYSTFDFFSYAIPGCCLLFACFLLDSRYATASDFLALGESLGLGSFLIILVVGYVLGFAVNPLGRWLYKTLGFRLFRHSFEDVKGLSISDKYVLIRELTPANFKYVETWNVFCAMAHNLAIATLIVFVNTLVKITFFTPPNPGFWIAVAVLSVFLFLLFLQRAVVFSVWAASDINSSIRTLHLLEQAAAKKKPEDD